MRESSVLLLGVAFAVSSCGGGAPRQDAAPPASSAAQAGRTVAVDKAAYPVFPDVDAGADPTVPPEQGGKGFTGTGWETNTSFDLVGDPHAVKGGTFREAMPDFPATLRYIGPNL